jgi:hypothetical protein
MKDEPLEPAVNTESAEGLGKTPIVDGEVVVERYEMQLKDAVTGEILGYGGGDTPQEAAQKAIEDAEVSRTLPAEGSGDDFGIRG